MTIRGAGAVLCLWCLAGLAGCSRPVADQSRSVEDATVPVSENFFPVSVWYSGGTARAPMLSEITEESEAKWRADLRQIKDLGFNTVRTWVEWAHCEPEEGVYRLDNLRLLARLADEIGLRFIIQLYVDSAPDWVGRKYPEARYETQSGARVDPQSAPGYCTDHEGVRAAVKAFLTETARVAARFPNFHGWDLWSEPHIVNWAYINYVPDVQFCYCPFTQARFRDWLQDKYGSLEALNQAWYRGFSDWSEVAPPRFGTILSYTDFIDWKHFIYDNLAADLAMRAAAVRAGAPGHVVTSHAAIPSIFYTPHNGYGASDDFLMAEQVDFYGTSMYPKHNHPDRHWKPWLLRTVVDFSASANRRNGGFYVGELQAGRGTYGLNIGNPVTPGDHRVWMWSAIAAGARAINFYAYYPMSSGYESGGYGLMHQDGSPTPRSIEAGKTAQIIDANRDLLLASRPVPAEVALVYNPLAQMVGGEQRHGPGSMHQESLFGYHRILTENNVPVEFIHRRDLEAGNLDRFRLIILPYPLMLSRGAANGIEEYVRNGGHVIAEARLAWNDERGFAAQTIPGMGLDQVFLAREYAVRMGEVVKMKTTASDHPLLRGLPSGTELTGAWFEETLVVDQDAGAVVLAANDKGVPCVTASSYGDGGTVLVGSFLGMAYHDTPSPANRRFVLNALEWAGVERALTSSHDGEADHPVDVRLQQNADGYLLFCINHGERSEEVRVELQLPGDGPLRVASLLHGRVLEPGAGGRPLRLAMTLPARDVEVLVIRGLRE
jgi:beta-galactosidase